MIISTRGKSFEFFEYEDFLEFLDENNYHYNKKEAIDFFIENKIGKILLSKLPFKKATKVKTEDSSKDNTKEATKKKQKTQSSHSDEKSKITQFIEKSKCPQKAVQYFNDTKFLIEGFKNPPQRYLNKTLYYIYLPDFKYYSLIIQDKDFMYFKNFNYQILDKKEGYYFDLFYIKFSILKNFFDEREILNVNGMCHFEGFNKKVIESIPEKPLLKIDFLEKLKSIKSF